MMIEHWRALRQDAFAQAQGSALWLQALKSLAPQWQQRTSPWRITLPGEMTCEQGVRTPPSMPRMRKFA